MGPKGSQYEPEGCQKGPNMSQKGAKMTPKGAKGRSKVTPKTTKNRNLEKGWFWGGASNIFLIHFLPIFGQKMRQKIDAKNDAKKSFKNHEN